MANTSLRLGVLGCLLCSLSWLANAQGLQTKSPIYPLVEHYSDVPYGADKAQTFDVYTRADFVNAPVIFMVHGGAWRTGDKAAPAVVDQKVQRWLPAGLVFISVNYRLVPHVNPLEQAQDLRKALVVAQQRAKEWGGDPDKFILMGHSAGAHLIGLVSSSTAHVETMGGKPWLGSVLLDSAALDLPKVMAVKHPRFYTKAFGRDPGMWRQASPLHQLTAQARPVLLACSSLRRQACAQAETFVVQAKRLGVSVSVVPQQLTHKAMNAQLGVPNPYTAEVEQFMAGLDRQVARRLRRVTVKVGIGPVRRWLQALREKRMEQN